MHSGRNSMFVRRMREREGRMRCHVHVFSLEVTSTKQLRDAKRCQDSDFQKVWHVRCLEKQMLFGELKHILPPNIPKQNTWILSVGSLFWLTLPDML